MKYVVCLLLLSWMYLTEAIKAPERWHWMTAQPIRFNLSEEDSLVFSRHVRYKRSSCEPDQFFDRRVGHCCKRCPQGQHVNLSCSAPGQNPICVPCESNTYHRHPNYRFYCVQCTGCSDTELEEAPCTVTQDRVCGCKEGFTRHGGTCFPCETCQNKEVRHPCNKTSDAVCGECLPGFYEEKGTCQPCNQSVCECEPLCHPVTGEMSSPNIAYVALPLLLLAFGGLFFYMHKWKKTRKLGGGVSCVRFSKMAPSSTEQHTEAISLTFQESPMEVPCFANNTQGQVPSVLQKGCALYDIIDCVPVKRWKEFMRILEFSDKDIERVEVEIPNFRDQQYEMLRRWCQLNTACVGSIYQALERMYLSGCAEALKTKIELYS